MRVALFLESALLILEGAYLYVGTVPEYVHRALLSIIFGIALAYLWWFFVWSKPYAATHERIAEGALIAAIIFNPFIIFTLDVVVWMFLDIAFGWIFFIYTFEVSDLKQKYAFDLPIRKTVEHQRNAT